MNEHQLVLFVITSLAVIIAPGQDMLLVLSRGVVQGSKAGIATAAGVSIGLLGHTLLSALGLGALLMASDLAFSLVKYAGAAYLIYLGIQLVSLRTENLSFKDGERAPLTRLFATGALSNISNPKVAIFYFAYLPQFISKSIDNPTQTLLMLGIGFSLLTFIVKGPVGFLAGRFSTWLRSRPMVITWINRVSGTVLVGLGLKLAFEQR